MAKNIVVVGTMDTKGREIQYLKKQIEARGQKAIIIDVSIGEQPSIPGDVTCQEIAKLGGSSSEEVWADIRSETGWHYIAIVGHNGAHSLDPYTLHAEITVSEGIPTCTTTFPYPPGDHIYPVPASETPHTHLA